MKQLSSASELPAADPRNTLEYLHSEGVQAHNNRRQSERLFVSASTQHSLPGPTHPLVWSNRHVMLGLLTPGQASLACCGLKNTHHQHSRNILLWAGWTCWLSTRAYKEDADSRENTGFGSISGLWTLFQRGNSCWLQFKILLNAMVCFVCAAVLVVGGQRGVVCLAVWRFWR